MALPGLQVALDQIVLSEALDSLEQAVPDREGDLIYLKVDPLLDPIRDEPRFKAVERALKFPD